MAPSKKQPRFSFSAIAVDENPVVLDEPGIKLFHDYKQLAVLPKLACMGEGNRWIIVDVDNGRRYKVEMVDAVGAFLLRRGWNILAATENLRQGDKLMFQEEKPGIFVMWIAFPIQHALPLGFSPARIPPAPLEHLNLDQVIVNPGVPDDPLVSNDVQKVWNTSSIGGPIYVCRLLISPSEGKFLIFNKEYTSFIPKQQGSVAMRYVGSDLIFPEAIKTYGDGNARMVKEWPLYASHHCLTRDEVFVCKIHRGPGTWEFIGCCARTE